jgi:hypothetical protein
MEDMAIFTKLFPIKSAAMNLSSLAINLWILEACFTPLASMWRSRILLIPMIEVSEREKNADKTAKIINKTDIKTVLIVDSILF